MDQSAGGHPEEVAAHAQDASRAALRQTARVAMGATAAVIAALSYGLLARMAAEAMPGATITLGAALLLPMAMGAIGAELGTSVVRRSIPISSTVGLVAALLYLAIVVATGLNGPLYIVALTLPSLLAAPAGAALSSLMLARANRQHTRLIAIGIIAVAPIVAMAFERTFPPSETFATLGDSQEISADRQRVWSTLLTIDTIDRSESASFLDDVGVPQLLAARMIGEGRDAVRLVTFENGIDYEEVVTAWHPPDSLRFTVFMDPEWIPADAVDPQLRLGGDQFDLADGYYAIDSLGPRRSRLTVVQRYRLRTALAPYLGWWVHFALRDAQRSAMDVVRTRAEAEGLRVEG